MSPQPWTMAEVMVLRSHDYLPLRASLDMNGGSLIPEEGHVLPGEMHQCEEACSPDVDSLLLIQEALGTLERQNKSVLNLSVPQHELNQTESRIIANPSTSPKRLPPSTMILTSASLYKESGQSFCLSGTMDPNPLLTPHHQSVHRLYHLPQDRSLQDPQSHRQR